MSESHEERRTNATMRQAIDQLCAWAERTAVVERVYVFGSRVHSNFRPDSDIDVAVQIRAAAGDANALATWTREYAAWQRELGRVFPCRLDLQQLDGDATPAVQAAVATASLLVFKRDRLQ